MSCHGCATKFGIFVKEHGCPGCGFAFCTKCLRYKRVIPKLGPDIKTVCRFCYIGVPDAVKKAEVMEPPAAFLKRLEALENPAKPPIVVYKTDTKMEQLKSGLAAEDRDIVQRLEKLREDRKKKRIPTEEEIRSRLAALKEASADIERAVEAKKSASALFVADTRSDEEKSNDLLKQLMEEQALEEQNDSTDAEIAKRLAKLRADDIRVRKGTEKDKAAGEDKDSDEDSAGIRTPSDDLEDPPDDPETNRLLQRLMKEAAERVAKKKVRKGAKASDDSEESDSELSEDSASTDSSHPRESRRHFINPYTLEKKIERDLIKLGKFIKKANPRKTKWMSDTVDKAGHTNVYEDEGDESDDESEGSEPVDKWWEMDNDTDVDWKGTSEELEEEESSYDLEDREPDPTMCFICQEIPTVKCLDCDRLYCNDDNIYFHNIPPYADHKIVAHEADKKSSPRKDTAE